MVYRPRSGSALGFVLLLALIVGVLTLAAVTAVAAYQWQYRDRIYEGVFAAGVPLGGMTLDEATQALQAALNPYPGDPVVLRYTGREWLLTPTDLGFSVNAAATAAAAFKVGRSVATGSDDSLPSLWTGLQADLAAQWAALRRGVVVEPVLSFDQDRLAALLRRIAREVDLPPQEGTLTIAGLEVNGLPGRLGRQVDIEATRLALIERINARSGGVVPLVVRELRPQVMSVDAAVAQARALLGRSLILVARTSEGEQRFAVDRGRLAGWLSLAPRLSEQGEAELVVALDRAAIKAFVQGLAAHIDRPAVDAVLDFDRKAKQVVVLQESRPGQALDVEAGTAAIEAALAPAAAADRAEASTLEIELPVAQVAPRIDSTKIAEMGIVEQIGEGTTYFAGSSPERVRNIVNAVEKFRGVVIPPGEQFSFYKVVGDVTLANGFVDSLIIVGDRTEVGVGGGVCQVSTTVYRAAFWAGFPILERYPHSYVVGWYGEPGWDASIFTPEADFRFLNDTGHYILIQPEIDLKKGRLTFYVYGTRTRTVEAEKGEITNRRPAPEPIYREDPNLPTGTIKQVDWAKEGMDVTVKRIIRYDDGRVKEEKIVSRYRPWQAVFLYGPGTQLPAGAKTQ